jgi:hypothetical protein
MGCLSSKVEDNFDDYEDISKAFTNKLIIAHVKKVYDGDTFTVCFKINTYRLKFDVRAYGYDAPEMKLPVNMQNDIKIKLKEKAKNAQRKLSELILNKKVLIKTMSTPEKFGRIMGEIYVGDYIDKKYSGFTGFIDTVNTDLYKHCINIHKYMITNTDSVEYTGGKKKNWIVAETNVSATEENKKSQTVTADVETATTPVLQVMDSYPMEKTEETAN